MRINASPLHLSSWNYTGTLPMSQRWALLTSGSKGQRSRSKFIDFWKWLMSHNCFPFTPIIMTLHTKTPLEWRVCLMGVRVKRSKVKVTMQWLLFFVAHNCFPFTSAIIKLHAQIPCESRICLILGFKKVESLNWLPRGVFVPLGQPHSSSFGWVIKLPGWVTSHLLLTRGWVKNFENSRALTEINKSWIYSNDVLLDMLFVVSYYGTLVAQMRVTRLSIFLRYCGNIWISIMKVKLQGNVLPRLVLPNTICHRHDCTVSTTMM